MNTGATEFEDKINIFLIGMDDIFVGDTGHIEVYIAQVKTVSGEASLNVRVRQSLKF